MKLNIILLAIVIMLIIYYWRLQVNKRGIDGFSLQNPQTPCPNGGEITSENECRQTNDGKRWGGARHWGFSYPKGCWQYRNQWRYFNKSGTPTTNHYSARRYAKKICKGGEKTSQKKIRLVGGNKNEGRLEINHNGKWGTVCDDGFGDKEAKVVCRQLGKRDGKAILGTRHKYGRGKGQIWLDDVRCSGGETEISKCSHRAWGSHNCGHHEDVGIVCGSQVEPAAGCPGNWSQVGSTGADIGGCGIDSCNARYSKKNISECASWCKSDNRCKAFTWAPLNGDKNHSGKRVCTRYSSDRATRTWNATDGTRKQTMCKQNIPRVTPEVTNDFWKGISACGCDWTTKHSAANFDGSQYKAGDYRWCWAPNSTNPSHKYNCENKTKHSMCRLNSKGHCVTRYQVPKSPNQGASKAFTNKVLRVKGSGLCLEADGGRGASIRQKICTGGNKQQFSYNPKTLELKTKAGECLDVRGGSNRAGANIITYPCKTRDNQFNQRFYSEGEFFKPMGFYANTGISPRDHNKGMCLTSTRGTLQQNTCKNGSFQQFEITDGEKIRLSTNEPHSGSPIKDFDGHLKIQKYKGYWNDKMDFFKKAPKIGSVKKVKAIHLTDEGEMYSYKIWGVFSPPKTGKHYFKTNSDDSSVMWVGKEKVVDNSTPHGMRVRTGSIDLVKGKHYPILIYFGEKTGYSELQFYWSSGGGWTKNLSKFYTSQTYKDIPCAVNFNGETYTVKRWTKVHGNRDEDVVVTGGGFANSEGVITIKAQDVEKIKGSAKIHIYPKQPPGGSFFADPIKWRNTDNNGTLYLSTGQAIVPLRIHNKNRKCFERVSAVYIGTVLPEAIQNCRDQSILAGRFWCKSCNSGYQKSKDGQNCNLIPIENCKTQKTGICKECNNGYDLSEDRKRCIKEAPAPPILPAPTNPPQNLPGIKGRKGPVGEVGIEGPRGPRGPKGRAAKASEVKGLPGLKGVQGVVGPKGRKGEKGYTGYDGRRGLRGYQGPETIYDPWVDNRVVKQLRKTRDKLSDKNKELDLKMKGKQNAVNIRVQMPRNKKKVIKKRILLKEEEESDNLLEEFSIYPPGRYKGPEIKILNAFNNDNYC